MLEIKDLWIIHQQDLNTTLDWVIGQHCLYLPECYKILPDAKRSAEYLSQGGGYNQ